MEPRGPDRASLVAIPKPPLPQRAQRHGLQSLEARLAVFTSLVLVVVAATLFAGLTAREHRKLIAAKTAAAQMLTQLLVTELGAAIDFGDVEDLVTRLEHLRANQDIVAAAVWSGDSATPSASWATPEAPPMNAPRADEADGAMVSPDWLIATRTITNPRGASLARVKVVFTLRPENDAFRRSRLQLLGMTAALAAITAALLGLLARRYVVGPLRRLADAATALAAGDVSARVETGALDEIGDLARAFNVMGEAVAFRQERLEKEIELAQRIQTSLLPRKLDVPGLEIAAAMLPATEVGGDYYDVLPVEQGCWIAIGDVAGHGLDAGLIMLMTQSIVAALVARNPAAAPREAVSVTNDVLVENIRHRLQRTSHVTLTLLRYARSGEVVFAGAHEDILVYRAAQGQCEKIATPGTWVGARRDIRRSTIDVAFRLAPGDVMLVYTDGMIETRNAQREHFGVDRLMAELARLHDAPARVIQEQLMRAVAAWGEADDDRTVMVLRYLGPDGGVR